MIFKYKIGKNYPVVVLLKIRNKFNVSIAEINYMDKWQRSEIAIALIVNNQKIADQIFDKILKIMEFKGGVEVLRTTTDFFEYDI